MAIKGCDLLQIENLKPSQPWHHGPQPVDLASDDGTPTTSTGSDVWLPVKPLRVDEFVQGENRKPLRH